MNEEIKEILDKIKSVSDFDDYEDCFIGTEFKPLIDYITNLQQENERLKNFINDIISKLARTQLNGTNKLDIVSDYIKSEYEKLLGGD